MAAAVLYYICLDQSWFCSVWACPLALGWIEDKVHSEASVLVSQPSDPLKEKEFIVQMLACHLLLYESHSPQQNSIRKAKLVMLLNLIFLFFFFPHNFLPLLHRLKCFEFSSVSIEFKWFFNGTKCKWMDQRCFLSLCSQDTGLEKQRCLHSQSCWLSFSWRKINV